MRRSLSALLLIAFFSILSFAQQPAPPPGAPADDPQFHQQRNDEDAFEKMKRQALKQQNLDRQKSLKKDTDQLLKLATQLKKYVDQTNENILSVEVIRKSEEIEKLARKVREKMKAQ